MFSLKTSIWLPLISQFGIVLLSVQLSRGAGATTSPTNGLSAQKVGLEILALSQKSRGQINRKNDASTGMNAHAVVHPNAKSPCVYIRPAHGVASSQAQACLSFLPTNTVESQECRQTPASTYDYVTGERLDGLGFPPLSFPSLLGSEIGNKSALHLRRLALLPVKHRRQRRISHLWVKTLLIQIVFQDTEVLRSIVVITSCLIYS